MKISKPLVLMWCGAMTSMAATAQQPSAPDTLSDPAAASSPHQRSVTSSDSSEVPTGGSSSASAASSPHQQAAMGSGSGSDSQNSDRDGVNPATFVTNAAQGGMTEVALSKAAVSKSKDVAVRQFAQKMVADHQKANDELSAIAKKKGMNVPSSLDPEHQAVVQKINNKSGADFDAAYGRQMAMDHAKTVALFQGATQSTDPDLAAFANKTLPTLREHKQMAGKLLGADRSADAGDPATRM